MFLNIPFLFRDFYGLTEMAVFFCSLVYDFVFYFIQLLDFRCRTGHESNTHFDALQCN